MVHPAAPSSETVERAAERVRRIAAGYNPPDFDAIPGADAALFLTAIDHRTGYRGRYLVDGRDSHEGSALMWALALKEERRRPGTLSAASLADVSAEHVEELFRIGGETVAGPEERARLWRDLAAGLQRDYGGAGEALLAAADGRLGGGTGLLARLAEFEAYSDQLQKKSFLFAKIAARRAWFHVEDPEHWEVCADNVLMRLALRGGLVHPGPVDEVRAATRAALKELARKAELPPPVLDDLLWELGRSDPDLLGSSGGDVLEPPRTAGTTWY